MRRSTSRQVKRVEDPNGQASGAKPSRRSGARARPTVPYGAFRRHVQSGWGYNQVMDRTRSLTAIIEREDDGYVSLCPELDIASQGGTIEEARTNLVEALTLFFETASPSEVDRRLHTEVLVTQVEVPIGRVAATSNRIRR